MKPTPDDELRALFAQQRRCDQDNAPVWHPDLIRRPTTPAHHALRWIPLALGTACIIALGVFLAHPPKSEPRLTDALPVLLDLPSAELFAGIVTTDSRFIDMESPTDFLLPTHINLHIP